VELESWDAWTSDDKASAAHTANVAGRYGNRFPGKRPMEQELEPEVDYFQEMQLEPSISRTKKVRISVCLSVDVDFATLITLSNGHIKV